jgi:hypothetical protein
VTFEEFVLGFGSRLCLAPITSNHELSRFDEEARLRDAGFVHDVGSHASSVTLDLKEEARGKDQGFEKDKAG